MGKEEGQSPSNASNQEEVDEDALPLMMMNGVVEQKISIQYMFPIYVWIYVCTLMIMMYEPYL